MLRRWKNNKRAAGNIPTAFLKNVFVFALRVYTKRKIQGKITIFRAEVSRLQNG